MAAGFCSKTVKPTKTNRRLKRMTAPNRRLPNKRYDVFKDISNLELYKKNTTLTFVALFWRQTIYMIITKSIIQQTPQTLILEIEKNIKRQLFYDTKQTNRTAKTFR